jgi:hypothetical protein
MPSITVNRAEYDWVMDKRKEIKPKKFESAAMVMKRIREKMEVENK